MKIGGLQPFTLTDFPGYPAAIVFTIGCNFRCPYCYNKQLWSDEHTQISEQEVLAFLKKRQGQLDGVVISGGEPTLHHDLVDFISKIKELGYKVKLHTNGSNPECLKELFQQNLLDFIAMDIKSPFEKYSSVVNAEVDLAVIERSMQMLIASGVKHEFRTTWDKKLLTKNDLVLIRRLIPRQSSLKTSRCV